MHIHLDQEKYKECKTIAIQLIQRQGLAKAIAQLNHLLIADLARSKM